MAGQSSTWQRLRLTTRLLYLTIANALTHAAKLRRYFTSDCFTLPLLRTASPRHSPATLHSALPLHHTGSHYLRCAQRYYAFATHCFATLYLASPSLSSAILCQCCAFTLLYFPLPRLDRQRQCDTVLHLANAEHCSTTPILGCAFIAMSLRYRAKLSLSRTQLRPAIE